MWENTNIDEYVWVDKIRKMRNAIHIFNYKNIGNNQEFLDDLEIYYIFVEHILSCLPPVEEYISSSQSEYEFN